MIIHKAFKYRIYPNRKQREIFARHFGCVRFVYNHFLRQRIDYYAENKGSEKKGLNYHDTARVLTQMKKQSEFEWLKDVNSQSLQQTLRDLDVAYNNFFNKRAKFPNFKRKRNKQSFSVPQHWSISEGKLNIPKCNGIKIVLHCPIVGTPKSVTISRTPSGRYYVSILCEVEIPDPMFSGNEVGLDYGVKVFITTSEGKVINSPNYLRKAETKLKRLQRLVSRKAKGSSNRRNAVLRLARQHEKVSNQRQDFLHKTSRQFVSENQAIFIESLAIKNMIRNHHLARSISDSGWNMFVNMLKYKGQWYGCNIHEVDRFFPSSKRCHHCGYIHESLRLSDRSWVCPECNKEHNRDVNAAINILTLGRAGTARIDACGEEVQQDPSTKQEAPAFMRR
jgi:putative transposase